MTIEMIFGWGVWLILVAAGTYSALWLFRRIGLWSQSKSQTQSGEMPMSILKPSFIAPEIAQAQSDANQKPEDVSG